MDETGIIHQILFDLLIILCAGFIAGTICRRCHMPMVVGYLLIGALIGSGMLGILKTTSVEVKTTKTETEQKTQITDTDTETFDFRLQKDPRLEEAEKELEILANEIKADEVEHKVLDQFAHLGANLLLFAIGLHFSPSELAKLWRFFLMGGSIQMLGVILPLTLFVSIIGGDWKIGLVLGSAVSLSSTVLVFKSLEDMGQVGSLHGVRAVAILLFQDVAVVPLLVLIGFMAALASGSAENGGTFSQLFSLGLGSAIFVFFVIVVRLMFCKYGVPFLLELRSVEIIVLFTMFLLLAVSTAAVSLQLPGTMGTLAAGVILSETRLTNQITAVTVAMRETFSAIFFVSLGALFDPSILFTTPILTLGALFGCLAVKTLAAGMAFRVLGLSWVAALGMGLGLSQLGELSFVLLSQGVSSGLFDYETYQRILFVALTSIILTPMFLKIALRLTPEHNAVHGGEEDHPVIFPEDASKKAVVIGLGPIGGQIATFLETIGFEVSLIDRNPVNLHSYAQHGFRTISGNAVDEEVLRIADIRNVTLVAVAVPDDLFAEEIVGAVRKMNDHCVILSRCRYIGNIPKLEQRGANLVFCGESELSNAAVRILRKLFR
ncbi:MAG: cation:proton antiporter [Planctomycetaceae bacterium]|jgi:CPA2 family monovalent cation:H+ antiporter-2|nr:cation:proton antiporter [Planctomycetaceae bacterium]